MPVAAAFLLAAEPPKPPAPTRPAAASPADNRRCLQCHDKFEEDVLSVQHAKAKHGCIACHGPSEKHADDDDHLTPPDTMIGRAGLNDSCGKCHASDKLSDQHAPFLAGTIEKKFCTECHGLHRLEQRKQAWDGETGKPVSKEALKKINLERKKKSP